VTTILPDRLQRIRTKVTTVSLKRKRVYVKARGKEEKVYEYVKTRQPGRTANRLQTGGRR